MCKAVKASVVRRSLGALVCFVIVGTGPAFARCGQSNAAGGESDDYHVLRPGPFSQVWVVPDPAFEPYLEVVVQAGEADHDAAEGLAHYVEHLASMNFGEPLSARHSNAATAHLGTSYRRSFDDTEVGSAIRQMMLVFDPFAQPASVLEAERDVVDMERRERQNADDLSTALHDMDMLLFAGSGIDRSIGGREETIASFTVEDAAALHASTHRPERSILIATGDIEVSEVEEQLAALPEDGAELWSPPCLLLPSAPLDDEAVVVREDRGGARLVVKRLTLLDRPWAAAELDAASLLLGDLLSSGLEGGLARGLVDGDRVARWIDVEVAPFYGGEAPAVIFNLLAAPGREVTLQALQSAVEAKLEALAASGVPGQSIERIRERHLRRLADVENRADFTHKILRSAAMNRHAPYGYSETLSAMRKVSVEQLNELVAALASAPRSVTRHLTDQREDN